jgi:hypothetical protein
MKNIFVCTVLALAVGSAFADDRSGGGNALAGSTSFAGAIAGALATNTGGNSHNANSASNTGGNSQNTNSSSNTGGNSQNSNNSFGGTVNSTSNPTANGGTSQNSFGNTGNTSLGVTVDNPTQVSNSTQITTTNNMAKIPVQQAYAAPLAASNGTCMGSSSGGAQGLGFGVSLATTWHDTGCDRRYNAQMLNQLGARDAALALMCQEPQVRAAMAKTATPCVE